MEEKIQAGWMDYEKKESVMDEKEKIQAALTLAINDIKWIKDTAAGQGRALKDDELKRVKELEDKIKSLEELPAVPQEEVKPRMDANEHEDEEKKISDLRVESSDKEKRSEPKKVKKAKAEAKPKDIKARRKK